MSPLTILFLATVVSTNTTPQQVEYTPESPVIRRISEDDARLIAEVAALFETGDFAGVLQESEKLSAAGAAHPEALNLKGAALMEIGRSEEARPYFEWAASVDRGNFSARYNLAECDLLAGRLADARRGFLKVPVSEPAQEELVALKIVVVDLKLQDAESASRHLPAWPPDTAAGFAAYAALAHHENDPAKRDALLAEARERFPDQWGRFLRQTLREAGLPVE